MVMALRTAIWFPDVCGRPTPRQLAVLEAFARTGSYKVAASELGIRLGTVRETLVRVRCNYGVTTSIQAYRAAVAAGDIDGRIGA